MEVRRLLGGITRREWQGKSEMRKYSYSRRLLLSHREESERILIMVIYIDAFEGGEVIGKMKGLDEALMPNGENNSVII